MEDSPWHIVLFFFFFFGYCIISKALVDGYYLYLHFMDEDVEVLNC